MPDFQEIALIIKKVGMQEILHCRMCEKDRVLLKKEKYVMYACYIKSKINKEK